MKCKFKAGDTVMIANIKKCNRPSNIGKEKEKHLGEVVEITYTAKWRKNENVYGTNSKCCYSFYESELKELTGLGKILFL